MTPQELKQVDAALAAQLDILRHASSVEGKVLVLLEQMQRKLRTKMAAGKLTEFGKARTKALLKETDAIIKATYAQIRAEVERSLFGVSQAAARAAGGMLPIAKLEVTLNRIDARDKYKLVNIDIAKFEEAWSKNKTFYVGPDGSGGIAGRYERVKKYIAENEAFEASSVAVEKDGAVGFNNGRHRYAAIRDAGNKVIPVAMDAESESNARAAGYVAQSSATSFKVGLSTGVLSDTVLAELVSSQLVEGAPSAAWWAKQADDVAFRFANIVRQGVAAGDTNEEIFRRTKDLIGLAGRNSRALVQTSVMQAASDARVAIIEGNTDIYKGYRHLSTLDGHTTEVCIARSNLIWDMEGKPVGHNLPFKPPPVHWNCRSVMVGVLKTFKEMGFDLPEPQGMTRSSAEGQIDKETSFEAFLGRRTEAEQDSQLGVGRAGLWREGKITLRQLVDNSGNALSLSQLRSKYE